MKSLFTLLMLLVAMSVSAQETVETVILKAGFSEVTDTGNWDDAVYKNSTDEDIIIVWKMTEEFLTISNRFDDKFVLSGGELMSDEQNSHADYETIYFNAYDKNGTSCYVVISIYPNGGSFDPDGLYPVRVRVAYTDIWYGYYCYIKLRTVS